MHYRYAGAESRYRDRTALGISHSNNGDRLLVQFDEPTYSDSGRMLHLGWHEFPAADWERAEDRKK